MPDGSEERFRLVERVWHIWPATTTSFLEGGRWYVNSGVIFPDDDEQRCPCCTALVGHAHLDTCTLWPKDGT